MLKYITSLIVPTPVQEWEVLNGYAKVAHGENAECYQKVIYANYGPHQLDFDLPTISDLEYESRFISNEPSKK